MNFSKNKLCARTREANLLYRLHLISTCRRRDCFKIYAGIGGKGGVMTFQLAGQVFRHVSTMKFAADRVHSGYILMTSSSNNGG